MANTFIFDDDEEPEMGAPLLDQDDDDQNPEGEEEEGNNRIFIMLLIGIGGFALVAILCIIGYFALSRSGSLAGTVDAGATSSMEALAAQQTQEALASPTLPPIEELTETPTVTSVVIIFATETPTEELPTVEPPTATFEALQTQLAISQALATTQAQQTADAAATVTPGGPTATPQIPKTGFAEDVGLPGLVIATIVLLGVILLARRLRAVPGQ